MGGPSVYVLLLLVSEKRTALSLWQGRRELGWKARQNAGRKKGGVKRHHGAASGDRCAETLLLGHDLVVIHRLIEMG